VNKKLKSHLKQQRGIAMIVALLALVLLAAIGMALMFMADTENSVNNNYKDSQKAYFAARAGAEQARLLIGTDNTTKNAALGLAMPSSGANTGMLYLLNPTSGEAIDPTKVTGATLTTNPYLDNQICWEQYTSLGLTPTAGPCTGGQLLPSSASFKTLTMLTSAGTGGAESVSTGAPVNAADALPFKWVRITNKQNFMGPLGKPVNSAVVNGAQVCWSGSKEVPITGGTCLGQTPQMTPVWELTSLAVTAPLGNSPGSRRIVQMEVAFAPPINPPAAIAAEAPIGMHGNLQVDGYDNCKCTTTEVSRAGKTCDGSHLSVFSAAAVTQVGNATTLTSGIGTGLTTYNSDGTVKVQGATAANQPWPYDVNQMISDYKTTALNASTTSPWNFSCGSTGCGTQAGPNFGTYPNGLPDAPSYPPGGAPATVYIPGNVQLTGAASGSGILIIDGDLDVHGGLNFYGLILVKGQITFSGGGASKVNLYGAILAGQDVNAQDGTIDGDSIGGSFNFHYDSCALSLIPASGPPKLLASHEIMY
jgi:hypothetical protein